MAFQTARGTYVDAFDLDHTLIDGNASFCFGTYLFRKKLFNVPTMLSLIFYYGRYKFFGMPVGKLHHKSFEKLFAGRLCRQIKQYAEAFLDEYLEKLIYAPALARLRYAQNNDHVTAIFSSSPDFLVESIAKRLGVQHWQATRYAVDATGYFDMVANVFEGEDKATALHALVRDLGVGPEATTVYSDSVLDLPFLKAAGKAVAVNPDKGLRAVCQQQGWEVI